MLDKANNIIDAPALKLNRFGLLINGSDNLITTNTKSDTITVGNTSDTLVLASKKISAPANGGTLRYEDKIAVDVDY